MRRKRYKPPVPDPAVISYLHRRLRELVSHLQSDYENYLKPLVLRMSKKAGEEARETVEKQKTLLRADSVKYLTVFEVARELHTLKSIVNQGIQKGQIEGVIQTPDGPLIPQTSVKKFGILIGKIPDDESLMDLFNERLDRLVEKYNSLIASYENMSRKALDAEYKRAKKRFFRQFKDEIGIDVLKQLGERGLREAFEQQVAESVSLISSVPKQYFDDIQKLVLGSVTGETVIPDGGLQKAIQDITGVARDKAKLIARDQTMKAMSTFTQLRLQNIGFDFYIWRNSGDGRVAGNPRGINGNDRLSKDKLTYTRAEGKYFYQGHPNTDRSKYHGNHWDREGKYFSWLIPPPDGNPGMGINCRCYAEPAYFTDKEKMALEGKIKIKL